MKITLHTLEEIEYLLEKDFQNRQTDYELKNGIIPISCDLVLKTDSLRVYELKKSDGQKGLKIAFKVGINSKFWFIWDIAESQAEFFLTDWPKLYLAVNNHNVKFWQKKETLKNET